MVRRVRFVGAFGALAWALACSSSNHTCAEMTCVSETGPRITLTGAAGGALPLGMYDIRVATETGAVAVKCDRRNPSTPATCTGDSEALRVEGTETLQVTVSGDPKSFRVYVSIDGTEVGAQSFTAEYEDREVNGAGCGFCRFVTVTPDPTIEL